MPITTLPQPQMTVNPFLRRPFLFLLIPRTLGPFNHFTLLNGWIC